MQRSRPLPNTRPGKVLLQDLAGFFVRDLWRLWRGRFVEIVHAPNEREMMVHSRDAAAVFVSLHGVLHPF
jgi:hypothetical protein